MTQTSTAEAARVYIELEMAPIPLPSGSKNPNRTGWQNERYTVEDVPRVWNNGQNIGLLCGSPSGGRVDVDCDCLETTRLAPIFLKPTLKGGRDTAPGSHWWYTAPGCPTIPFRDVDGKRILELRADGCQTVVFPSIHPEGDAYRWYKDRSDKMVRADPGDLVHRTKLLFTAAIIDRHMPPIGGRHDYSLALAGFLLRHGRLGEDDVRLVMVSAWDLLEDATREAIRDVENSIKTTAQRLRKNMKVKGGGALAVFDERLTKAVTDAWEWQLAGDEDHAYGWNEPEVLPENLPPVPVFDYRMLPEAFGPWVEDVSDRMQVPPDFVGVPLMVVLSAVVGRSVGIRPKRYDDWTVIPNLWGAIVGRPGLLKSPALNEALAPMNALIRRAGEAHEEAMSDYEAELEVHQVNVMAYEAEKRKLAKGGDKEALREYIEECRLEEAPAPPAKRRYRTQDTTTEKLGELLNQNPGGMMVFRDELVGFLSSLDRYGREGDRKFYLEAWNGDQSFDVDRIGRGSLTVEALCLSILGGIQPGPLSRYVYDAGSGQADDDGLLPRFQMLAWPDLSSEWEEVDRYPDAEARNTVSEVFAKIDALVFECPDDASMPYLRFTPEAQDLFGSWRADLEREVRGNDLSPAMEAHKAKYRSLFPALALLIELADSAAEGGIPQWVGLTSAAKAMGWCDYLEKHARRVYHSAEQPEMRAARELLKRVRKGDVEHGAPVWSIRRNHWFGLSNKEEVIGALEVLEEHGWLKVHRFETGGRPGEAVLLNPSLRQG